MADDYGNINYGWQLENVSLCSCMRARAVYVDSTYQIERVDLLQIYIYIFIHWLSCCIFLSFFFLIFFCEPLSVWPSVKCVCVSCWIRVSSVLRFVLLGCVLSTVVNRQGGMSECHCLSSTEYLTECMNVFSLLSMCVRACVRVCVFTCKSVCLWRLFFIPFSVRKTKNKNNNKKRI